MIPQIQPPHVTPHILMKVVSKFHSPSPSSLGGVRGKPPPGIKRFSFIDMYRCITNAIMQMLLLLLKNTSLMHLEEKCAYDRAFLVV